MTRAGRIAATGVLAALYCAVSLITVPIPAMPLTLQCFAVTLGAYSFGTASGTAAVTVYIAAGLLGLPVFSGMQGGAVVLAGPTGGFLVGFFLLSVFSGLGKGKRTPIALLMGLVGLTLCYAVGVAWFAFVSGSGVAEAFILSALPYLPKDIGLTALAYYLSLKLCAALEKQGRVR